MDKISLHVKDPYGEKYQFLTKKCENVGLKHCRDLNAFIEQKNHINDICKNIGEYNLREKT